MAAMDADMAAILKKLGYGQVDFLSLLLLATVLPFLDGKASSANWAK